LPRCAAASGTGNFTIPEDGIALTPDTKTLYYNALQGLQLYSVPTACLRAFPAAGEPEPCAGSDITDHGAKPSPMDGMSFSDNGKLYFGGLMKSALYEWDPATPLAQATQKASSSRDLQWPDTFAWDGRGNILFTTNKLQVEHLENALPPAASLQPRTSAPARYP
jgi:sugar lactone lactonase YvrE